MKKGKTYDLEFKTKVIQEYKETGKLTAVARSNGIPVTTLRQWILSRDPKSSAKKSERNKVDKLEKENQDLKVQVEILKELLKKTNQA